MISKEQYQHLKKLCKSQDTKDVNIAGVLTTDLRKTKKISLKMVNNLFSCIWRRTMTVIPLSHGDKSRKRDPTGVYFNGIDYITRNTLKNYWLNGELW